MDMQRQAFEESNNITPDWSFKFDDELQQYVAIDFEMTLQVEEFNEHWDTFRAGWQAANKQFESFLNQAIEDSACADERRSLQVLLEDFQDNLEADKRKGQKRVAVNLEDL